MKEKLIKNWDGSEGRIFLLSTEEVKTLCRPGEGANTCIWLVASKGFECLYYNRQAVSLTGETLDERWRKGLTVAKRDGCDEIRAYRER